MAIPIGARLGPYEVLGLLGGGAMGEVHRARDTRLGREVAIKTLPPSLSNDSERLRRFETEARAASQLSHPNILSVFDVGTADGQPYIVSELLEGETLRERLSRGPLPVRRSVEIAAAVAGALAAAHPRGIVHRDLKPENLFLTRDGRAKILDFGIAKLTVAESAQPSAAETLTKVTDVGVAVGTLAYMSPEQIRGEPLDHRSDIFALGTILHEMIAGAPTFRRDSRIATVNAILESDPPDLPDAVPPAIREIVGHCLAKNADDRFQSARDLAFALSTLTDTVSTKTSHPAGRRPTRTAWWVAAAALLLAAGAAAAVAVSLRSAPSSRPQPPKRFAFVPPVALSGSLALSPDGTRLVYATGGGDSRLYLRALDELDATPIAGTENGRVPFFSPDGRWVAFRAGDKLKKVPVAGGAPVTLSDVSSMLEGSWAPGGSIVIAQRQFGLMTVPAEGGTPSSLTTPDKGKGEIDHHAPNALPGGAVLFTIHAGTARFRIAVRSASGEQRTLLDNGFFARYVPSGHIIFGRAEGLFAVPFDVISLRLTGPPVLVAENVLTSSPDGVIAFATAADGTLAYVPAVDRSGRSLMWVDRAGRAEPLPMPTRAYAYPTLSPDGTRLAVQISDGARNGIWLYEFATGSFTRFSLGNDDSSPVWAADGRHLSYASRRQEEWHILWQPISGRTQPESLVASRNYVWPGAWTADGERLIYVEDPPTSIDDINLLRVREKAAPQPLVDTPSNENQPALSPDGLWLAYVVNDGTPQIMVRSIAGGVPRQITPERGSSPRWSRDGRELFFRSLASMMRVAIQTTPELRIGKPEKLFDGIYVVGGQFGPAGYDVAADGQRFLMVKPADTERVPLPIHIVVNWFDELKRRVPTR